MPARTNVRLSVDKSIYKSCTTLSSQLGTFPWKMTVGYTEDFKLSSYSKEVTHTHYGRHVTDCS